MFSIFLNHIFELPHSFVALEPVLMDSGTAMKAIFKLAALLILIFVMIAIIVEDIQAVMKTHFL